MRGAATAATAPTSVRPTERAAFSIMVPRLVLAVPPARWAAAAARLPDRREPAGHRRRSIAAPLAPSRKRPAPVRRLAPGWRAAMALEWQPSLLVFPLLEGRPAGRRPGG